MKKGLILTAAVAALFAFGTPGAHAQGSMAMSKTPDYSLLTNPLYDYTDLKRASAGGYSDKEVATMAKIADKTGQPFVIIYNAVRRGETFGMIATWYGLKLSTVMDSSDYVDKIDAYKMAYETTGMMAMKKMMMK